MGINLTSPTGLSSATLIADSVAATGGSNDSVSTLTEVGGIPVSAALEIQSTKGTLLFPRMTSAQIAALTTTCPGMSVYNTDTGSFVYVTAGATAAGQFSEQGQYLKKVTLTTADVGNINGGNIALIAPPGAGKAIIVHKATLVNNFLNSAFTGGGAVRIQFGAGANNAGTQALSGDIPVGFVTATGPTHSFVTFMGAVYNTNTVSTGFANIGLYISNTGGAFTGGAGSIDVNIWYSIVSI